MPFRSGGFQKIDNFIDNTVVKTLSSIINNEKNNKTTVIIITGATGSGKSKFAMQLAREIDGIIINADSRQIYKQIPIITAQPTNDEKQEIKHFLYSFQCIAETKKQYSVGNYLTDLSSTLNDIKKKYQSKVPIIVGGTMLYIDSILNGINNIPEIPTDISSAIRDKYKNTTTDIIYNDLKKLDSKYANIVDRNNQNRIIRGIEVFTVTGKSIVDFWKASERKQNKSIINYFNNIKKYIISVPRDILYERINQRFDLMIKTGAIEEAKALYDYCLSNNINIEKLPKTIGLQELFSYFQNKVSLHTAIEEAKQKSRNYAKRQMTWWR